jgi:hypothetical protein
VLPFRVYRRFYTTDGDESVSLAPQWLVIGMGYRIAYNWAYDHNLGGIRTSLWRRVFLLVPQFILGFLLNFRESTQSKTVQRNVSTGICIARIGYRLWYGVLRPLPGPNEGDSRDTS